MTNSNRKGQALIIGLDSVDPAHYNGWDGKLSICEKDAEDVKSTIADAQGFTSDLLLTKNATRTAVRNSITNAAQKLNSGDSFFIYYSGHGGSIKDTNSDESDSLDETWCLYDGQLIDDEIYTLLGQFKKGVKISVLSDSCHSGTTIKTIPGAVATTDEQAKFMPDDIALATYKNNKGFYDKIMEFLFGKPTEDIKASVKLISACQDNQLSRTGPFNSVFTAALFKVWDNGKFNGNTADLHEKVIKISPSSQTPNLFEVGLPNSGFNAEKPFTI